jgi:hypothetical protein
VQAVTALPTGTVTLLFTDIEGSIRLLQLLGADKRSVSATFGSAHLLALSELFQRSVQE